MRDDVSLLAPGLLAAVAAGFAGFGAVAVAGGRPLLALAVAALAAVGALVVVSLLALARRVASRPDDPEELEARVSEALR